MTLVAILATATAAVAGLLIAGPAAASPTVDITGDSASTYAFSPTKVEVGKGAKVHWSWDSNAPHNVTFKKLGEASATADRGSYKLKFRQAGTYKYLCTVHGFKGKVVVG
ncbi:MAG: plastocyanin/azurin family copper-binding protein [Vicinamibacteria bacterium]|jgi:plastocyanin